MSSFNNGTYFLVSEQYRLAERAFRAVTRAFPNSYEAWANRGYALLMQYADGLDTEDLKRFGIGHIVIGGFYRRPVTLEAEVRGIDEELWWDAVGALREAEARARDLDAGGDSDGQPNLAFVKANLGLAYLLRPFGKDPGKAIQYFEAAETELARLKTMDPFVRLAMLNNLAVAYCAGDREEECSNMLVEAKEAIPASVKRQEEFSSLQITYNAVLYNAAMLLSDSEDNEERQAAVSDLEKYLSWSSPASAWWKLAYERYRRLSGERSERQLKVASTPAFRPVFSVSFDEESTIALGQPSEELKKLLGQGIAVEAVPRTNLKRIHYGRRGVEFLANEEVLAIVLKGPNAPRIKLEPKGPLTGSARFEIYPGMTKSALERLLVDSGCTRGCEPIQMINADVPYRFYRSLGIAVLLDESDTVAELIVVQVLERRS